MLPAAAIKHRSCFRFHRVLSNKGELNETAVGCYPLDDIFLGGYILYVDGVLQNR